MMNTVLVLILIYLAVVSYFMLGAILSIAYIKLAKYFRMEENTDELESMGILILFLWPIAILLLPLIYTITSVAGRLK
jgi:hypothetical protein